MSNSSSPYKPPASQPATQPHAHFSLWDAASIIVGIIIGASIFRIVPDLVQMVDGLSLGTWQFGFSAVFLAWALGGVLALIGALCFAELAAAFPQDGGTYVYLSRGLGKECGLWYAWIEFWIIRPGNIGAVAFIAGDYFQ
jgi:amino acid transporter